MVGVAECRGPYVDADGKADARRWWHAIVWRRIAVGSVPVVSRFCSGLKGDLIVFHAYDAVTGKPALQISTLTWQNDWPHAALEPQGIQVMRFINRRKWTFERMAV